MYNHKHSYSDGVSRKRIAIFGHVPPPYGGVATHIERVMHKFSEQKNKVFLFNTLGCSWRITYGFRLLIFLLWHRPHILYNHTNDLRSGLAELQLLVWLKKIFRYRLVLVEHNCRHLYTRDASYKKRYASLLDEIDQLVLIGNPTAASYQNNGMFLDCIASIESAFLPPLMSVEWDYPEQLKQFFKMHRPLIIVSASRFALIDGKDLYGIDLTTQAIQQLKNSYPEIGLVVLLAEQVDANYYSQWLAGVNDRVFILRGNYPLWPLLKKADLFVRPTRSDAASVSVEETLYVGIPVIASDAAPRPNGVIIFRSGDANDLCDKMHTVLRNKHENIRDHLHPQ